MTADATNKPRIISIDPVFHIIKGKNIVGLSWVANNVRFGAEPCDLQVYCHDADGNILDMYSLPVPGEIVGNWAENGDLVIDDFVLSSNSNYKLQTDTK